MHSLKRYHFRDQQDGEEILHVIRRHWFDILYQFFPVIFILLMVLLSFLLIPIAFPDFLDTNITAFLFVESLILLVLWMFAAVLWIDYYLDVWIITNMRVVNVEQKGLFLRHVSELRYKSIEDVTTEVGGIIPTFLNYGDVLVQTAAEQNKFRFHNVPDPYKVKDVLMKLQKHLRKQNLGEIESMLKSTEV